MTGAIKFKSIVRSDHTIRLPSEVPEGPVEIVVLVESQDENRQQAERAEKRKRAMGSATGTFTVPDDFDDALPPEILRQFEGGGPVVP